jgi:hypothetical protein
MVKRVKTVQESDLRMLGSLARNIQRVLPVTQADIDAAAALGKGWVVWKVFEVSDPLDNMRGGTQLIIRQNSIQPGQNVRRVIFVAGPGGQTVVIRGTDYIVLPDAIANSLSYVKAFGGTEQRNLPDGYIERQFIYMMDGSYLLTDIVPTYDCKVEMDFQTTSTVSQTATYLGVRTGDSVSQGLRFAHITSKVFRVYGFGSAADSADVVADNTRYKFVWNNQRATLTSGNTTVLDETFTDTGTTTDYLAINGWNISGTVSGNIEGIYLYSFKVWNAQGELVADYVPAVQKGTVPVVGFYDTVSETFKTATAGTFAAGGEAVPTPDTPMNIVCNNGVLKSSPNLLNPADSNFVVGATISSAGSTVSSVNNFYTDYYIPVKPNTSYVATGRKSDNTISAYTRICWYDNSKTFISRGSYTVDTVTVNVSPANAAYARITCAPYNSASAITLAQIKEFNWVFQEGTVEPAYMPYGQIYADGTVETINAHGKNLFDVSANLLEQGGIASFDGQNTAASYNYRVRTNGYVPVKPNTVYTASVKDLQIYYLEYEQDKTYTDRRASGFADNTTFTTGANTYFIRLQFRKSDNSDITPSEVTNVQLERGSTATAYEPYYDGGTATAEMLLKIGDYQDEQEILSGAVTRKVGVKVLDGTEAWSNTLYPQADAYRISWTGATATLGTIRYSGLFCTHFEDAGSASTTAPNKVFFANDLNINFPMISDFNTVAKCLQWLADQYAAGTPVIVVYPLATPTTESVAGQTLQVTDGDNVLEITQASMDGLELEAKYNAAVTLTIQEVQDANLDNNVTVTIQ